MDYTKIDAALAVALEEVQDHQARTLSVFVHLDPAAADRQTLARVGIPSPSGREAGVCSSNLSAEDIALLSRQSWVRQLRLSSRLRLLDR